MLRSRKEKQQGMEVVILEQMVPENHLLRKIDRSIDFSFINKLCAPLYSENVGRPAVDPEILFRMLFVGYLYGIRSERRLEEEINYNFAYKWFCGLRKHRMLQRSASIGHGGSGIITLQKRFFRKY